MASIEEKVEEHYKKVLDDLHIRHYGKNEAINDSISKALKETDSKSGGAGNNFPDIQLLLQNKTRRDIPVMIEAKGTKGQLEKLASDGSIELVSNGKNPHMAVQEFAVNGALHYGKAVLSEGTYNEVIVVGINGTTMVDGAVADPEIKAYYVAKKNDSVPKEIVGFDFVQVNTGNCITLSTTADSSNTVFYQEQPFIGRQQIAGIRRVDGEIMERYVGLYLTAAIRKITRQFNYANKLTKEYLKNCDILLPVIASPDPDHTYTIDDIDWQYMEQYIRAMEKLAIADVVEYKDKVIATTKEVVEQ